MATVYSLICWGGKDGKSVSVNATTDLVSLTNHGLRDGKGVQFASGTLPTVSGAALALATDYFAKWISTSTFELYYDSALTSKIDFTSTGSSLVLKGSYYQGLSDTSRWGTNIFDGLVSCYAVRSSGSGATTFDAEVIELGEDFDDIRTGGTFSFNLISPEAVVTSTINGVRTSAFHGGIRGAGYVFSNATGTCLSTNRPRVRLDGFTIAYRGTSNSFYGCSVGSVDGSIRHMILDGPGIYGIALSTSQPLMDIAYNLIVGWNRGLSMGSYTYGANYSNNTIVGNVYGVYPTGSVTIYGYFYNNAVFGNSTANWNVPIQAYVDGASCNTGEVGDTNLPWSTGANPYYQITSADFANYAGGDYRPASAASLLFDAGTDYYGRLGFDIADDGVPNYNNGGAEGIDIGCYEFDNGFGPHPASHTLTLTNVVIGSRVFVRDQADTTTHYDQIAASSTVEITVTIFGDARDNWRIRVRKASASPYYQPYETLMTATAGSSSIYVSQIPDETL